MKNKTCLITGSSSGIGKAIAFELSQQGYNIIQLCRNKKGGEEALNYISQGNRQGNHQLFITDLSDFDGIRNCAREIKSKYKQLDVLINNAGTFQSVRKLNNNGIELQFAVNYLAPYLLTNLLLDMLKKSDSARIINIASLSHYMGRIHFEDISFSKRYDGLRVYEQSKLALVLFTYELARKLKETNITANCADPGRVNTHIGNKESHGIYKWLWILNKPILSSVESGAKTAVYLATSDFGGKNSGKYFKNCKEVKSSKASYNEALALKLWDLSSKLTSCPVWLL